MSSLKHAISRALLCLTVCECLRMCKRVSVWTAFSSSICACKNIDQRAGLTVYPLLRQ